MTLSQIFLVLSLIIACCSVQLPTYNISLDHNEEFIISDLLRPSDVEDVYDEEEMIKEHDDAVIANPQKFWRIHRQSFVRNSQSRPKHDLQMEPFWENITKEEFLGRYSREFKGREEPNKAEIAKRNDEDKGKNFYIDDDDLTNKTISYRNVGKRNAESDDNKNETENYDYESFKAAYENQTKLEEMKNDTLKYNETKEDESPKDAIKTLMDFSPRNCTKEEMSKFSFGSVECLWIEAKNPHFDKNNKFNILEKIAKIVIVWVLVYLMIVLPLWCQYGWCCCCCRCKYCKPRERIEDIKTFYMRNPVGIFHDEKGNFVKYEPTSYEKYAQKKLGKALDRL